MYHNFLLHINILLFGFPIVELQYLAIPHDVSVIQLHILHWNKLTIILNQFLIFMEHENPT